MMTEDLRGTPESFLTRHSISYKAGRGAESDEFPGLTEEGERLANEQARKILKHLESKPPRTVCFLGGSSELIRSKSTVRAYGKALKRLAAEEGIENIVVYDENDIRRNRNESYRSEIAHVVNLLNSSGLNKKVVIVYPLTIRGFGVKNIWADKEGAMPYYDKLQEIYGKDDEKVIRAWFENKGFLQEKNVTLQGPDPVKVAEEQIIGLQRLRSFARKYLPGRPIEVGAVGHSFNLDALAVYLMNDGEVTPEGFDRLGGMIKETEMIGVEIKPREGGEVEVEFFYGDRLRQPIRPDDRAGKSTIEN